MISWVNKIKTEDFMALLKQETIEVFSQLFLMCFGRKNKLHKMQNRNWNSKNLFLVTLDLCVLVVFYTMSYHWFNPTMLAYLAEKKKKKQKSWHEKKYLFLIYGNL